MYTLKYASFRDRAVYISYKSSKMRPFVLELGKNAIAVEVSRFLQALWTKLSS